MAPRGEAPRDLLRSFDELPLDKDLPGAGAELERLILKVMKVSLDVSEFEIS